MMDFEFGYVVLEIDGYIEICVINNVIFGVCIMYVVSLMLKFSWIIIDSLIFFDMFVGVQFCKYWGDLVSVIIGVVNGSFIDYDSGIEV